MDVQIKGRVFVVDDEDAEYVRSFRWHLLVKRSSAGREYVYARRSVMLDGRQQGVLLHREIAGAESRQVVDHINGDPLDNRRANLRVCTQAENARNRQIKVTNKTGCKGVRARDGKYSASVAVNGRSVHCGTFATVAEAAQRRDEVARELHGQYFRASVS